MTDPNAITPTRVSLPAHNQAIIDLAEAFGEDITLVMSIAIGHDDVTFYRRHWSAKPGDPVRTTSVYPIKVRARLAEIAREASA